MHIFIHALFLVRRNEDYQSFDYFILTGILICHNDNSVDPDQTPRIAAFNLGLHCLPMPYAWESRH